MGTMLINNGSLTLGENGAPKKGVWFHGGYMEGTPYTAASHGPLISNQGTLTIYDGVAIEHNNNASISTNAAGGCVTSSGTFNMHGGKINNSLAPTGGAVAITGGTFNMYGGTILKNHGTNNGGGVTVQAGVFNMSGGEISDNTTLNEGAGVYVNTGATFNMSGGAIKTNTSGNGDNPAGGGLFLNRNSTARLTGGEISQNASGKGGGVGVEGELFISSKAAIKDNTAYDDGGGIYAGYGSAIKTSVTMSGGEISGNRAINSGGGACVQYAAFDFNGGDIKNNNAADGGGLRLYEHGIINITDGTISGNTASRYGGGAFISAPTFGKFNMTKGTIKKNNARFGGGVYILGGEFSMPNANLSITENSAIRNGGGVFVADGVFSMTNGAVSNNTAVYGGGVYIDAEGPTKAEFNMAGGSVSGNSASSGGGVYIAKNNKAAGTFNMNGGTISGNTATDSGGGVQIRDTFSMSGGAITGNIAKYGGGVSVSSDSNFNVSNSATVIGNKNGAEPDALSNNVYVASNRYINVGALESGAAFGVTTYNTPAQNKPVFFAKAPLSYMQHFTCDNGEYIIREVNGFLLFSVDENIETAVVRLRQGSGTGGSEEFTAIVGAPIPVGVIMPTSNDPSKPFAGYFTGTGQNATRVINLYGNYVPNAKNYIDDSGNWIYTGYNTELYALYHSIATVTVDGVTTNYITFREAWNYAKNNSNTNTKATVKMMWHLSGSEHAQWPLKVDSNDNIELDLNGFTIDRGLTSEVNKLQGCLVYVDGGKFILNDTRGGGKLTGGNSDLGGGVYVAGGTFTMTEGGISGNRSSVSGGGVFINAGSFEMNGGEISGNTSSVSGGGVHNHGGQFVMTGGEIKNNNSQRGGGAYIMGDDRDDSMSQSAKISNNSAAYGGGVFVPAGAVFDMSGGEISGNTASSHAGGAYIDYRSASDKGRLNMSGGARISNNSTSGYGGGVYADGDLTMSGIASISGNSSSFGAGAMVLRGALEMSGDASITDNHKANSGGGVYIYNDTVDMGTLKMSENASISGNTAPNGGGVFAHGTVKVSGNAVVSGNKRGTGESEPLNNILLYDDSTVTVESQLYADAELYVTTPTRPTFERSIDITKEGTQNYSAHFKSDDNQYETVYDGDRQVVQLAFVIRKTHVTLDKNGGSGGSDYFDAILNAPAPQQGIVIPAPPDTEQLFTGYYTIADGGTRVIDSSGAYVPGATDFIDANGNWIYEQEGVTLYARYSSNAAEVEFGGAIKKFAAFEDAWNYAKGVKTTAQNRATITLLQRVDKDNHGSWPITLQRNKYITLDLNSFTIDRGSEQAESSGEVIGVYGDLILQDSGTGGKLTGGKANYGGGVNVGYGGVFTMQGGEISLNSATNCGGGVYIDMNGTFTMSGGEIKDNNAADGGGVYVRNDAAFNVSSSAKVSGNTTEEGAQSNIYLSTDTTINVEGTLGPNAELYVTTQSKPTIDTSVAITGSTDGSNLAYFNSDDPQFKIEYDEGVVWLKFVVRTTTVHLIRGTQGTGGTTSFDAIYNSTIPSTVTMPSPTTPASIAFSGYYTTEQGSDGIQVIDANGQYARGANGYTSSSRKWIYEGTNEVTLYARYFNGVANVIFDSETKVFGTFANAWDYAHTLATNTNKRATVTLFQSVDDTNHSDWPITAGSNDYITLNLNNYDIDRGLDSYTPNGSVVRVEGDLTLTGTGKLTGGYSDDGGGVYIENGGVFTMQGCEISGNRVKNYGGGVYVGNGASFNVSGAARVADNTMVRGNTDTRSNIYLCEGREIGASDLTGAELYVTTAKSPTTHFPVYIANITGSYADEFESDSGIFDVEYDNGVVQLTVPRKTTRITLDQNGGTGGDEDTTATFGSPVPDVNIPTPPANKMFLGYYEQQNGAGTQIIDEDGKFIPDVPLYTDVYGRWIYPVESLELHAHYKDRVAQVEYNSEEKEFGSFKEAWDYAHTLLTEANNRATVKLLAGVNEDDYDEWPIVVGSGDYITLDLNNYNIDRGRGGSNPYESSTGYVIRIYGDLTLTGPGKLTGGSSRYGGGVYVESNGSFTMKGGEISGNKSYSRGGGVYIASNGSFTMKGGEISGNSEAVYGGGVYIDAYSVFTMSGGAITGNEADRDGGGVYVCDRGTFNMPGGGIIQNRAADDGGGVYLDFYGAFNVSGTANVSGNTKGSGEDAPLNNIYLLDEKTISVNGQFGEGAELGVTIQTEPTLQRVPIASSAYDCSGVFTSDKPLFDTVYDTGVVYLYRTITKTPVTLDQTDEGKNGTTSFDAIYGLPIPDGVVMPTPKDASKLFTGYYTSPSGEGSRIIDPLGAFVPGVEGYTDAAGRWIYSQTTPTTLYAYYSPIVATVIRGTQGEMPFSTFAEAWKYANGLETGANNRASVKLLAEVNKDNHNAWPIEVKEGAFITLDLNGHDINRGLDYDEFYNKPDNNVLTIYGDLTLDDTSGGTVGKLTGGSNSTASPSGGVIIHGGFTMRNGEISGNYTRQNGGGVYMYGGTFKMNGGKISGNTSKNLYGGGVYVAGGTFTMNDGIIKENTASSGMGGGGVYVGMGGRFYMEAGEISGNTGPYGGGVSGNWGLLSLSGGEITGNSAYQGGGGVYVNGPLIVSGAPKVYANTRGGNIYLDSGRIITIANASPLATGAVLWVTTKDMPMDKGSVAITTSGIPDNQLRFFDSDEGYKVIEEGEGEEKTIKLEITETVVNSWAELKRVIENEGRTYIRIALGSNFSTTGHESTGGTIRIKDGQNITIVSALGWQVTDPVLFTITRGGGHITEFFNVDIGGSLTLGSDAFGYDMDKRLSITLDGGGSGKTAKVPLIAVSGELNLLTNVELKNNLNSSEANFGGGVRVYPTGSLNMNGCEIENNRAVNGGGVYVADNGSLTIGEISTYVRNNKDLKGGDNNIRLPDDKPISLNISERAGSLTRLGVTTDKQLEQNTPLNVTERSPIDISRLIMSDNPRYAVVNGPDNVVQLVYITTEVSLMKNGGIGGSDGFEALYGYGIPPGVVMPHTDDPANTFMGYFDEDGVQVIDTLGGYARDAQGYTDLNGNWIYPNQRLTLYAQYAPAVASVEFKGDTSYYVVFDDAWNHARDAASDENNRATVTLLGDVNADNNVNWPIRVDGGMYITLDLNGRTIDRGLSKEATGIAEGHVVEVRGSLVLEDSGTFGTITGGNTEHDGGGVEVRGGGVLDMRGGSISGNKAGDSGGGVDVRNGGKLTMSGGDISRNTALRFGGGVSVGNDNGMEMSGGTISNNTAPNGGGIYVLWGSLTIEENGNSRVANNTATGYGGGVCVDKNGKLDMKGGAILNNTSNGDGGGVFVAGSGKFEMSGGAISGNRADSSGGGVNVNTLEVIFPHTSKSTFNMTGGTISGNNAQTAGGVYVLSTFNLSGAARVAQNTMVMGSTPSNIYLSDGKTINVTGALESGEEQAQLWVSAQTTPTYGNPVNVAKGGNVADDCMYFKSDSGIYTIGYDTAASAIQLKIDIDHTTNVILNLAGGSSESTGFAAIYGSPMPSGVTMPESSDTSKAFAGYFTGKDGSGVRIISEDGSFIPGAANYTDNNGIWISMDDELELYAHYAPAAASVSYDKTTSFIEFEDAWAYTVRCLKTPRDYVTVTLLSDIGVHNNSVWPIRVPAAKSMTLDLNGYKIDRGLGEATEPKSDGSVLLAAGTLSIFGGKPGSLITGGYSDFGGGVYVQGRLDLYSGKISGNRATRGGGVYVQGKLSMESGEISGNSAEINGGGIYMANPIDTANMPEITRTSKVIGNTRGAGSDADNIYLAGDRVIDADGLADGAQLGVTCEDAYVGRVITYRSNEDFIDSRHFVSDDPVYIIYNKSTKYVELGSAGTAITLNPSGGIGGDTDFFIKIDEKLPAPLVMPTRDGYTFKGYFTTEKYEGSSMIIRPDGTLNPNVRNFTDSEGAWTYIQNTAISLYARWTPNNYTVTYDSDGATAFPDDGDKVYNVETSLFSLPSRPAKTGWYFAGWQVTKEATSSREGFILGEVYSDASVNLEGAYGDVTLKALWVQSVHNVTVIDGRVIGGMGSAGVPVGSTVTIYANSAPQGKIFIEWETSSQVTFVQGTDRTHPLAKFTMPDEDVTITAKIGTITDNIHSVTVTGGSGSGLYIRDNTVTIICDSPEAGMRFKEWIISPNVAFVQGTSARTQSASFTMPGQDVTATSTYEEIPLDAHDVTVIKGTGGGGYKMGETVIIVADPPEAGKRFKEWVIVPSVVFVGDTSAETPTAHFTMLDEPVTATATYVDIPADSFDVTVIGGMGTGKFAAGDIVTIAADSHPSGKRFKRWIITPQVQFADGTSAESPLAKFIMPNGPVTATATYADDSIDTCVITYDGNGGTGTMPASTVDRNRPFTLPACSFTAPAGQRFASWAIGSPNGVRIPSGGTYTFTGATIVYAIWEVAPSLPAITTAGLPNGKVGTPYDCALTISGTGSVTWSSDNLPAWLTLNGGKLSGTPLRAGTYSFTVTATSAAGSISKVLTISVSEARNPDEPLVPPKGMRLLALPNGSRFILRAPAGYAGMWMSGNSSVATIDENGRIRTLNPGYTKFYFIDGLKRKSVLVGDEISIDVYVVPKEEAVAKVSVTPNAPIVAVNGRVSLGASVSPATAKYKQIAWTSANEQIASVDSNGVVTGLKPGKVNITATSTSTKAKTITVTVTDEVKKIQLNASRMTVGIGGAAQLIASVIPDGAENGTITWTSGKKSVATVDANGLVRGVKKGKATITATSANGVKAKCVVTVKEDHAPSTAYELTVRGGKGGGKYQKGDEVTVTANAPAQGMRFMKWVVLSGGITLADPTSEQISIVMPASAAEIMATYEQIPLARIHLSPEKRTMSEGDIYALALYVEPTGASLPDIVRWTSDEPSVASVNADGQVEAVSEGVAAITAQSGAFTATCTITVEKPDDAEVLTLMVDKLAIQKGKKLILGNLAGLAGTWSVDDDKIADVNLKGVLKAKKIGEANLTFSVGVAQKDAKFMGKAIVAGDQITIRLFVVAKGKAVTKLTVKPKSLIIAPGEKAAITASVSPKKAEHKEVYYRSDDERVAAADPNGVVTGARVGSTTITATSTSGIIKTITVTVSNNVVQFKLNANKRTLKKGATFKLSLKSHLPAGVPAPALAWKSGNDAIATVDSDGLVTAVKQGKATITATAPNGTKATCKVTVK